jgi:hypothetical protein
MLGPANSRIRFIKSAFIAGAVFVYAITIQLRLLSHTKPCSRAQHIRRTRVHRVLARFTIMRGTQAPEMPHDQVV